jgi:UDP-N-acetylmuramate dehydrogenase
MIEKCGWEGRAINHVGVYQNHAAVLVNHGDGTECDIWELATRIRQDLFDRFGIYLVPETHIVE